MSDSSSYSSYSDYEDADEPDPARVLARDPRATRRLIQLVRNPVFREWLLLIMANSLAISADMARDGRYGEPHFPHEETFRNYPETEEETEEGWFLLRTLLGVIGATHVVPQIRAITGMHFVAPTLAHQPHQGGAQKRRGQILKPSTVF